MKTKKLTIDGVLDFISKNLGRLKTVALIFIFILFGISSLQYGCTKKRAENLLEQLTGVQLTNMTLQKQIDDITVINENLRNKEDSLARVLSNKEAQYNGLLTRFRGLKQEYEELAGTLVPITPDESYKFLNQVAYPFEGVKQFPFSNQQVKGMHLTYLQKNSLQQQNESLFNLNALAQEQLFTCKELNDKKGKRILNLETQYSIMETMYHSSDSISVALGKEIDKNNKRAKWWKRGVFAAGLGGFTLGLLIVR